jgi:hypothetical protein
VEDVLEASSSPVGGTANEAMAMLLASGAFESLRRGHATELCGRGVRC